jgi:hypothetical protein
MHVGHPEFGLNFFVLAKDHELLQAVGEREAQLADITQSLAEYKHRALQAEVCFSYTCVMTRSDPFI